MRSRGRLLVVLLTLLAPSAASAHHRHHRLRAEPGLAVADPVKVAEAAAFEYWSATPCGGTFVVQWATPGPDATESGGWATWTPGAPATNCTLNLSTPQWPTRDDAAADFPDLCRTVVHEWGHLLGASHSSDPTNVMYPLGTSVLVDQGRALTDPGVPPECHYGFPWASYSVGSYPAPSERLLRLAARPYW